MGKAKKLPSGSWRIQSYDYTDSTGKRHYKSFTASTKKEAEFLEREFLMNKAKEKRIPGSTLTLKEAIKTYIDVRENPRKGKKPKSPSTILGYRKMLDRIPLELLTQRITELTKEDIQGFVDSYSETHSPKTTKNIYGLIHGALKENEIEIKGIELPDAEKPKYYIPTDDEVKKVIEYAIKKDDKDLLIAVYLGAYGCMRRSEICALDSSDIDYEKNIVRISKSCVRGPDGIYVDKDGSKTESSNRLVKIPQKVIDALPRQGRIVSIKPHTVSVRFNRALDALELPHFRFHDLRHYSASIMHALGFPDQYIMERGGWSSDHVMKAIYRNTLKDYQEAFADKINEHFSNL